MKEERLADVIDGFFETHDICTTQELYHYVQDYREKNDCYVPYDRDEFDYVIYSWGKNTYYYDENKGILYKQVIIECPCCGAKIMKYPDVKKFENVERTRNQLF